MKLLVAIVILLNGQAIDFKDAKPYVESSTLMIPLRGVFEQMGAEVEYSAATNDIEIRKGDQKIEVAIGKMNAYVNGKSVGLDFPARRKAGRVYVPLRLVAESLGAQVNWDNETRTAKITTQSEEPTPPVAQGPVTVQLKVEKKRYARGEKVKFTVIARNTSRQQQRLEFRGGRRFDISVYRAGGETGEPLWRLSEGMIYTLQIREIVIEPGQALEYSREWNQKGNNGKELPRGEYSVTGEVTAQGLAATPPLKITLAD